jgi:signal transduction histidine kinase
LVVLGALCGAFVAVLVGLRMEEHRRLEQEREQVRAEEGRQLGRWLEIADRPMQELLLDLASWPDTRAMLKRPDPDWLRANVNGALSDRQFDVVWLLRADGHLVHVAQRDAALALPPTPDVARLAASASDARRRNFFQIQDGALWQIRTAPLEAAGETAGWVVVARCWSDAWLSQLAALTDAPVRLQPADASVTSGNGKTRVLRPLADLDGRVLRQVELERADAADDDSGLAAAWSLALLCVAFGALLLTALALAVRRWVLTPLGLIGESLRRKDPAVIAPLLVQEDEFTPVAQLVESAHVDRVALQTEIAERRRTESVLRESQENLRHSVELRARLARDLHDNVIQSIYAAGLGLEGVRTQLATDPVGAEERMKHCMTSLNETIRTVRAYISDLEPEPPAERQRFTDAVRALTHTMHELWPVDFALELDDAAAARLTNLVELHALQIVRESVSNALRHGRASRIDIRLREHEAGGAQLEVRDNGRGFDPVQKMGTGRGLVNITSRAREMGATVRIESGAGAGTLVRLHLPGTGGSA